MNMPQHHILRMTMVVYCALLKAIALSMNEKSIIYLFLLGNLKKGRIIVYY